jgi:hypothetical protein
MAILNIALVKYGITWCQCFLQFCDVGVLLATKVNKKQSLTELGMTYAKYFDGEAKMMVKQRSLK